MARCDAGACIVASADGTNIGGLARSADPQCRDSESRGVEKVFDILSFRNCLCGYDMIQVAAGLGSRFSAAGA